MYIIRIEDDTGQLSYIGGSTEGSQYSNVYSEQQAKRFETMDQVNECLNDPEFTKRNNYGDGTSAPPPLIWRGLNINNNKKTAFGRITVFQMKFESVLIKDIFDQLKRSNDR